METEKSMMNSSFISYSATYIIIVFTLDLRSSRIHMGALGHNIWFLQFEVIIPVPNPISRLDGFLSGFSFA